MNVMGPVVWGVDHGDIFSQDILMVVFRLESSLNEKSFSYFQSCFTSSVQQCTNYNLWCAQVNSK